ncbi:MAG TPA: hypothetical protein VGE40_05855 [Bacilli bacterium]
MKITANTRLERILPIYKNEPYYSENQHSFQQSFQRNQEQPRQYPSQELMKDILEGMDHSYLGQHLDTFV